MKLSQIWQKIDFFPLNHLKLLLKIVYCITDNCFLIYENIIKQLKKICKFIEDTHDSEKIYLCLETKETKMH